MLLVCKPCRPSARVSRARFHRRRFRRRRTSRAGRCRRPRRRRQRRGLHLLAHRWRRRVRALRHECAARHPRRSCSPSCSCSRLSGHRLRDAVAVETASDPSTPHSIADGGLILYEVEGFTCVNALTVAALLAAQRYLFAQSHDRSGTATQAFVNMCIARAQGTGTTSPEQRARAAQAFSPARMNDRQYDIIAPTRAAHRQSDGDELSCAGDAQTRLFDAGDQPGRPDAIDLGPHIPQQRAACSNADQPAAAPSSARHPSPARALPCRALLERTDRRRGAHQSWPSAVPA